MADAVKLSSPRQTVQKALSAAALEKFRMGVSALIQMGMSPAVSVRIRAPASDSAASGETDRAAGARFTSSRRASVATGASIRGERNQW